MKLRNLYKREYRIWKAMRARCNAPCYKDSTYQKNEIKCEIQKDFVLIKIILNFVGFM